MLSGDRGKKAVLPSELKRLLRSKKSKSPDTSASVACFGHLGSSPHAVSSNRRPLRFLSTNIDTKTFTPSSMIVERPQTTWILLTQLTVTCGSQIAEWIQFNAKSSISALPQGLRSITEKLDYYRFPYPELSTDARNKIKTSLGSKDSFERDHFQKIADAWRKSLLALYGNYRARKATYFYFLQSDLVILFRWINNAPEASIVRATRSLINMLTQEGIKVELDQNQDSAENDGSVSVQEDESLKSDLSTEDRENVDPRIIKDLINKRLNRTKRIQSGRRSAAVATATIKGESNIHGLIDYLLNQKDGKSYVILPELVSPDPFLLGTLCKTEYSVIGPLEGDRYQIKLAGLILPSTVQQVIDTTFLEIDASFRVNSIVDPRTDPLVSLQF